MSPYLVQVSYTAEAWKALVKSPEDRAKAIRPAIEKLGGSLEGAWFAFGDYDLVLLLRMPDNVKVEIRRPKSRPRIGLLRHCAADGRARTLRISPFGFPQGGLAAVDEKGY